MNEFKVEGYTDFNTPAFDIERFEYQQQNEGGGDIININPESQTDSDNNIQNQTTTKTTTNTKTIPERVTPLDTIKKYKKPLLIVGGIIVAIIVYKKFIK